jgi:flagellin
MERLASGRRINRAGDDAAGLAISEKLGAAVRSLEQASRNVDYGSALARVADSAMADQSDMLVRMRELAVQSANGALGDEERAAIQAEFGELRAEIDRVATSTNFNNQQLLQGASFDIQAGAGGGAGNVITVQTPNTSAAALGLVPLDVSTAAGAQDALDDLDSALASVSSARGRTGAQANRLESAQNNLGSAVQSTTAAYARIADADVAQESANLATSSTLLRANLSVLKKGIQQKGMLVNLLG